MSKAELVRRYVLFLFGLFVNSLGIALATRANLGTSPITSVPYVLSIRFPLSLGMFTLFFSLLLIAIQLIILGKRFPKQFLLQLPVIPIFSVFIDLSMALFWFVDPQTYPAKVCSLLLGCLVLGFGVFIGVAANVVMLPGESFVRAVVLVWKRDFGKTKVAFDVSISAAAAVLAKTHRDEYMRRLAEEFPQYGWAKNKGYPTREHRLAVRRYGVTPYHRLTFNHESGQLELF